MFLFQTCFDYWLTRADSQLFYTNKPQTSTDIAVVNDSKDEMRFSQNKHTVSLNIS